MQLVDYSSGQVSDRDTGDKVWGDGCYDRIRFKNGYGASIISGGMAYGSNEGLLEIAVIRYLGDGDEFELCYDTEVTSDVIGHLTRDDARRILDQIAALPPDARALPGARLDV
jgi:hypothetical protein